jgi:hypothetical protein
VATSYPKETKEEGRRSKTDEQRKEGRALDTDTKGFKAMLAFGVEARMINFRLEFKFGRLEGVIFGERRSTEPHTINCIKKAEDKQERKRRRATKQG